MAEPTRDSDVTGAYTPAPLPDERFAPGTLLAGRFRIVSALGKGGMGEVYRADDLTLGQPVALKFLPPHLAQDPDRLRRFRKEVAAARRVSHPNVCRVYDIVEYDGQSFLTMEFVDGEDLSSVLKRLGRVPEEKGVEAARQLCLALAAVHEQGLLHRDLKPANVMLDGRGKVRFTDFGLAAAAQDLSATEVRSGTPLYQAPEQLSGMEVTPRSDIYALGLVLYELFTGKRAFPSAKRESSPSKPSSHVSTLDPAVERVILRCLETDPAMRPKSAYEVLAALPGGDPLAAALAAGETPSPQLVADAPIAGILHPAAAAGLLAVTLGGLLLMGWLGDRFKAYRHIPLPAPAVLEDKARSLIRDMGYADAPADFGGGFNNNLPYLRHVVREGKWEDERPHMAAARPAAVMYWYRQARRPLVAGQFVDRLGSELIALSPDNPSHDEPGMVLVRLDTRGRLVGLVAVPDSNDDPPPMPLGWDTTLRAAGLDAPGVLRPMPGITSPPPVFADQTAAWEGTYPERPDIPIRVEAGSYRGRLVYFNIAHPSWELPTQAEQIVKRRTFSTATPGQVVLGVVMSGTFATLLILAVRNLSRSRADARGAARLAGTLVVLGLFSWLFAGGHATYLLSFGRFMHWFGFGLTSAALWGVGYLALEPMMRRRCPHRLTALARALDGRWRDPLVGRDVLIGVALGVASAVEIAAFPFGLTAEGPVVLDSRSFTNPAWTLVLASISSITAMWGLTSVFLVLSLIVRRDWIAAILLFCLLTVVYIPAGFGSEWVMAGVFLRLVVVLFLLLRIGVLALIFWYFAAISSFYVPLTLDTSAWYFGASLTKMLAVGGLAVYGFVISLGGRPLFGKSFFGDA